VKKEKEQLIIGIHPLSEAIKAGKEINKVLLRRGLKGENFSELFGEIRKFGIPFQFVPVEKLDRVTKANHQGVIAFLSIIEYKNIEEIVQNCFDSGKDPFIIVLDQITDVRNFGAIARTAECAGADALIIPSKGSVSITPDALKTSAGALNRIPVCRSENLLHSIKFLQDSGIVILAASEKVKENYFNIDLNGPIALVLGAEEVGINPNILKIANRLVSIPLKGKVASLNVSVACGIITFEIVKQRILAGFKNL
jgi:23S rRNA (guanosine2251-2'-O)-methyltransferase